MKISIVIPSRERGIYLRSSIQSVLSIKDPDIELIVADNASSDNTAEVVAGFSDPRLVLLPSERRVSMRENFNRAVLASTGDYVIVFGDDDAILPGQFPALRRVLEERRPDGVSWQRATYGWPIEGFGKKTGGLRFYREHCFGAPMEYDARDRLDKLLAARLGALTPAPDIYHGCVSRAYLDWIAPQPGVFFDSIIPDVNFQYRSMHCGGRFVHLRHPFTINGYSPVSNGTSQGASLTSESAKIRKAFLTENRADPFDDVFENLSVIQLVFFSTLETMRARGGFDDPKPDYVAWYQYALTAMRHKPEQAAQINSVLKSYAEQTGTKAQLEKARGMAAPAKRTLKERLNRLWSQLHSFRVSAAFGEQNTVYTATQVMDEILGHDLQAVLDGRTTPSSAWSAARKRSRAFESQL